MKKRKMFRSIVLFITIIMIVIILSGCEWFSSKMKNIKGELVGNNFTIDFFDNFGNQILEIDGDKVGMEANYIPTESVDSDGNVIKNYELSSVVTITVDGNQVAQTGNTIIFAEEGIKKLKDFKLPENIITDGGSINIIDRNINNIKNMMGTEKVIIVCSQLGVPLAVYGGKSVYWEIPNDLSKTTKINIDGLALYIHRANYILLDGKMIK